MTKLTKYQIFNSTSLAPIGIYEAVSANAALDLLATDPDYGYESYAEMQADVPSYRIEATAVPRFYIAITGPSIPGDATIAGAGTDAHAAIIDAVKLFGSAFAPFDFVAKECSKTLHDAVIAAGDERASLDWVEGLAELVARSVKSTPTFYCAIPNDEHIEEGEVDDTICGAGKTPDEAIRNTGRPDLGYHTHPCTERLYLHVYDSEYEPELAFTTDADGVYDLEEA